MEYPSRKELLEAAQKKRNNLLVWLVIVISLPILFFYGIASNSTKTVGKPIDSVALRNQSIANQFTAMGSHNNLETLIISEMNDPESYEHIETTYTDLGELLVVTTTFRGKNAFGAKVKQSIQAEVDLNGNIIKVFK